MEYGWVSACVADIVSRCWSCGSWLCWDGDCCQMNFYSILDCPWAVLNCWGGDWCYMTFQLWIVVADIVSWCWSCDWWTIGMLIIIKWSFNSELWMSSSELLRSWLLLYDSAVLDCGWAGLKCWDGDACHNFFLWNLF